MPVTSRNMRRVGLALAAVGIVTIIVWAGGIVGVGLGLLSNVREAESLMADPGDLDLNVAGALLMDVRTNVIRLDRRAGWLVPLAARLRWMPVVGHLLGQVPALLELADSLSELGVLMWRDFAPILALHEQGAVPADLLPDVAQALLIDQPIRIQLADRAAAACGDLDITVLPDRFVEQAGQLCQLVPLLAGGLDAADAVPALLGLDSPSTYLLLAFNEDELRPGGGFITGVGEIHIAGGRVASMEFRDSYKVDDFSLPYPDPPDPLQSFMAIDLWVFRDSNWSPDFPTAADRAISLYRPGYPVEIDGVIGIDQIGVQMLVGAIGSLELPGAAEPVTGDSFFDYIHDAWAPDDGKLDGEWWQQRKSFMADVAAAVLARVDSGDLDTVTVAKAALAMLETRHLQIYLLGASAEEFLTEQRWNGALRESSGDFLMIAEANLGYNKVSANVARSMSYEIDLRDPMPHARVNLIYDHLGQKSEACVPEISYDLSYVEMMDRCYWAYTRLLVPQGALLLDASETPIAAEKLITGVAWPGQADVTAVDPYTAFGLGFLLPTTASQQLTYAYQLPASVVQRTSEPRFTYHLLIQKQAGVLTQDVDVVLRLPRNAVVLGVHPGATANQDGVLLFEVQSETDIEISVDYRLPEDEVE
ncbi:MAG: DUF4012 domain-containing protein [Anaerolineae bacterium]|nr:DUF4012 domain-containing protein [Anaerolineae bacterium]